MKNLIKKAVFPVAGLGTRFLPATKASPKEMLPVVDKPIIQYAVEEAIESGITELIFITGRNKRAIEDHFDKAFELETDLTHKGKKELLQLVKTILPKHVNCIYIRQSEALGLGHAVLCAKPVVGNEPFAVLLADDLIRSDKPVLKQMIDAHEYYHASILGVEKIELEQTKQYGVVKPSNTFTEQILQISHIVEKPAPEKAPSQLGVVGRYILTPRIFSELENTKPGAGGEIQLTDAIEQLIKHEQVLAHIFEGKRYDCGSKLGYLKATLEYAVNHPEVGADFTTYLKQFICETK